MTDIPEKDYNNGNDNNSGSPTIIYPRPTGIKGIYYHPVTQVSMLGFVCFMCPGIPQGNNTFQRSFHFVSVGLFNALTGLGGGGQVDPTISAKANTALYATFAVGAFFSG